MHLILSGGGYPASFVLSLSRGQRLDQLAGQIPRLTLSRMSVGHSSGYEVHGWIACLAGFSRLGLTKCDVAAGILMPVASYPSVKELNVFWCDGVGDETWLGLAAARTSPLQVMVRPRLPSHLVDSCTSVARRRHCGSVFITFKRGR